MEASREDHGSGGSHMKNLMEVLWNTTEARRKHYGCLHGSTMKIPVETRKSPRKHIGRPDGSVEAPWKYHGSRHLETPQKYHRSTDVPSEVPGEHQGSITEAPGNLG